MQKMPKNEQKEKLSIIELNIVRLEDTTKINIQKSIVYLYTNNEHLKFEKQTTITKIKCLGVNLRKSIQNLPACIKL